MAIIVANLVLAIAAILDWICGAVSLAVIASVILSWVNADRSNGIVVFITTTAEFFMAPVRRVIRPMGRIDLSPIVVILAITFIQIALIQTMRELAVHMKYQSGLP